MTMPPGMRLPYQEVLSIKFPVWNNTGNYIALTGKTYFSNEPVCFLQNF